MEQQQVRSESSILRELKQVSTGNNTKVVEVQLGNFKRPRRTCVRPYVSEYRGNAIMTVPYGAEGFEFSFSIRKGLALNHLMEKGIFQELLRVAVEKQREIDGRKSKSNDVIEI
jgi:hypothetical protein